MDTNEAIGKQNKCISTIINKEINENTLSFQNNEH